MEWHEKIIVVDHRKQQRWSFEANMYDQNPTSKTLKIWTLRYLAAYEHAHSRALPVLGSSRLMKKDGKPVAAASLATAQTNRAKTEAVQDYLKKNGGMLFIEIEDNPSLSRNEAAWDDRERLLLFRCGVIGTGPKFIGMQYLRTFSAAPKEDWERTEASSWQMTDLPLPSGYTNVDPPPLLALVRPKLLLDGEVL